MCNWIIVPVQLNNKWERLNKAAIQKITQANKWGLENDS